MHIPAILLCGAAAVAAQSQRAAAALSVQWSGCSGHARIELAARNRVELGVHFANLDAANVSARLAHCDGICSARARLRMFGAMTLTLNFAIKIRSYSEQSRSPSVAHRMEYRIISDLNSIE